MNFVDRAADIARGALHHRHQAPPKLRTSAVQPHPPIVYFCTPDYDVPAGGIRVAYRQVDLLNQAGIPAAVLHRRSGFRCTWFENSTRVVAARDTVIGSQDLIVVGELDVALLARLRPGMRFVVFNQNPHLSWKRASPAVVQRYVTSPDLAALVTVSNHSAEMLRHLAPAANVLRVHNSIDPAVFFPGHMPRPRTISYMPRRGRDDAEQVLGILEGRGALDGWEVKALARLTEREVADGLRSTSIFLSFAHHEGFGLPAAEAMACGNYVVGFHGFSGMEFFRPEFSSPVDPGDILGFAQRLEWVLAQGVRDPGWCGSRGVAAAIFIAAEYSPEREREDVVGLYASLMASETASAPVALVPG